MAAVMTSDYDDTDRLAIEISECQHMGIDVLPPDVNESFHEFAVVPDGDNRKAQIRFGMNAIKNVGAGAVEEIIRARKLDGPFKSVEDYLSRVNPRIVNRKNLESLIKAGALDRFEDRSKLMHNLDLMIAFSQRLQKEANSGQTDLFGNLIESGEIERPKLALEKAGTVYTPREQLLWERELLGLYLSQHPLAMFETYLEEQCMPMSGLKPEHDGRSVVVGGAINDVREITTKNGSKMAFVKLEDKTRELELILFPGTYQQTTGLWAKDNIVLVRGKLSAKDREGNIGEDVKVLVEDAREITGEQAQAYQATGKKMRPPGNKRSAAANVTISKGKDPNEIFKKKETVTADGPGSKTASPVQAMPERVYIRLHDSQDQKLLVSLKQSIDEAQGETEVVLVLGPSESKQIIKLPNKIVKNAAMLEKLRGLVGADNVKVQ
jgi:DNA polymerase-3 subunit alpha